MKLIGHDADTGARVIVQVYAGDLYQLLKEADPADLEAIRDLLKDPK